VFYQEGERVNALLAVMKKAFGELDLGLQGALSMTESMQTLFNEIFLDRECGSARNINPRRWIIGGVGCLLDVVE
jgi:hypothetical protein